MLEPKATASHLDSTKSDIPESLAEVCFTPKKQTSRIHEYMP